jgi:hypothetical protein
LLREENEVTNIQMLEKMRGPDGFRQFGPAKVQRMFKLSYGQAITWMDWLTEDGFAERDIDRPWEVRLI